MERIRAFTSATEADSAARLLRSQGIDARVASRLGGGAIMGAVGHGVYEVILIDPSQAAAAERVLEEWRAEPPLAEGELESQAKPDLSQLDPRHRPKCPDCGVTILDERTICAGCGRAVDIEALIVEQHGPEALAVCYPDEPEAIPDSLLESAALNCSNCQYPLESLPSVGVCPECGARYSKSEMLQRRLGPM